MRTVLTRLTVLAGLAFAVTSFWLAVPLRLSGVTALVATPAPRGEPPYLPAFFILGIMLVFLAAVVYELLPGEGRRS